jgi:hypothetical protein
VNECLPNPKLIAILSQIQVEVQNFILRLASEFAQRKEQLISLINNYDLILSVLSVIPKTKDYFSVIYLIKAWIISFSTIQERIKEDSRESQNLRELLTGRVTDYVEEVLMPYFGNLICFVKECELLIERDNISSLKTYESRFKRKFISF